MKKRIAIIGYGNMGQAIAQGLLDKKVVTQNQLILTNSKTQNNNEAVLQADVIILAIKPKVANIVLNEIKSAVQNQLVISIMAGLTIDTLKSVIGEKAIIRVMPNLAAKNGKSMSVWVKSKKVTKNQRTIAKNILEAIGTQVELKNEIQIDKATAISGSGPAYFFYIVELLTEMGMQFGFSEEISRLLAEQTFIGAAKVLAEAHQDASTLRRAVTSKGGTTEAAFKQFEREHLDKRFMKGVDRAYRRAKELGKM